MKLRRAIAGDIKRPVKPVASSPKSGRSGFANFLNKLLNIFLLLIVGLILIFCILLTGSPRVKTDSQFYRSEEVYQTAVMRDSNFFHKTKLTYSGDAVANKLQHQFPEISKADISLSLFSTSPVIRLDISPPGFIVKSAGASYIVDSEGEAVIPTTPISSHKASGLYSIDDQSGRKLEPGTKVLSQSDISFIKQVITQVKAAKLAISSLSLPPLSQELDLKTSDEPYLVKFYLGGDPQLQAGQFLAARHSFTQKNVHPSQYLDVRVAGKVFFR